MTTKQTRWHCPNNCPAVLGPTKPRRDDVRRYCLVCSALQGRLVERTAPALDKRREERAVARKAKTAKAAWRDAAQETAYYTVVGLDLRALVAEFCRTPALSSNVPSMRMRLRARDVTILVRRCSRRPQRLGFARYSTNSITIADYPGITPEALREIVLHELSHLRAGGRGGESHGVRWKTVFRLACEQAIGVRPRVENRFVGEATELQRDAAGDSNPEVES